MIIAGDPVAGTGAASALAAGCPVVVGFTAASAHAVLPRLLERAREQLPDVKLELREMVSAVQLEGLMTGEIDLGMVRPPMKRLGIVSWPFLHEQLVAALPVGHPLATLHPEGLVSGRWVPSVSGRSNSMPHGEGTAPIPRCCVY
jgi:DNA-binding transcriptional LysR family regulator